MTRAPRTGGCNCGAVRAVFRRPFGAAGYCHCSRCRRRTGMGSSASAAIARAHVDFEGADAMRAWSPPDGSQKVFCGVCGSQIMSQRTADSDTVFVRFGFVDGDPGVRPTFRQFTADAPPWDPVPDDGLPRFAGPRPA